MEFSVVLVVIGFVLVFLAGLVMLVRAFQVSAWWGVAYLFLPLANVVFVFCHWARARGSFFCTLIGIALIAIGAVAGDRGPKSLFAALTSSRDGKDFEKLTASIEEQRTRIESLEDQFQIKGAELAKQFQELDKRRKGLKANDAAEVERFNVEAEAYTAQNMAHKAIGAELESARKELTVLLDERARIRASNPSDSVKGAAPARNPTSDAAAGANGKRVVMYTTATCPACVAAKTYLARKGVRYEERDVERSSKSLKGFQSLGGRGVPLILVGNERMVGFDPRRFEQMIGG